MPLTQEQLEELRAFNSPTIANAIETLDNRSHLEGVTQANVLCVYPDRKPIVAYACTAAIRSLTPPDFPRKVNRAEYWRYTKAMAGPKLTVIQDLSEIPGGAYWGEVNSSIHLALGSVGVLTNGTVRDIDEVEKLGFALFASGLQVSHGHAHLESFGHDVEVFGMRVRSGDLIHADKHGAVVIPAAIAAQVAEVARRVELAERPMLEACRAEDPIAELDRLIPLQY